MGLFRLGKALPWLVEWVMSQMMRQVWVELSSSEDSATHYLVSNDMCAHCPCAKQASNMSPIVCPPCVAVQGINGSTAVDFAALQALIVSLCAGVQEKSKHVFEPLSLYWRSGRRSCDAAVASGCASGVSFTVL